MFGVGFYSKSANVTRQQRTNLYLEPQKDNDKSPAVLYGTPGLTLYYDFGYETSRGMFSVGDLLYTVHGSSVYSRSLSNVLTTVGTLGTTSGPVSMAWNGTQLMIVDGVDGWTSTSGGTLTKITDGQFPLNPTSVCFLNGYFVVSDANTGRFYWSSLLDGTAWDALDFATAESSPDNLVRVAADHGELYLFGQKTTEIWVLSGDAATWTRLGGAAAEWGLAAYSTLAQSGDSGLMFLAQNRLGETQVIRMDGYSATVLSDPAVSHAINAESNLQSATAFSYMIDGHPFYQLNLTASSFLYDGLSQVWSIVSSGSTGARHYAQYRASFAQKPYVSDYRNGNVYLLDKLAYTDNAEPIIREVVGRHVFTDYELRAVLELQVDFEEGVGLTAGQGVNPQAMLQISKDGGHTWGNELWQTLGAIGKYGTRVIWRRLGLARDWLFKLRITDPVKVVIIGAGIKIE